MTRLLALLLLVPLLAHGQAASNNLVGWDQCIHGECSWKRYFDPSGVYLDGDYRRYQISLGEHHRDSRQVHNVLVDCRSLRRASSLHPEQPSPVSFSSRRRGEVDDVEVRQACSVAARSPAGGNLNAAVANGPNGTTPLQRDRLTAELEAERKRRQELEQQLAAAQSQGSSRPQGSVQPATPALRAHALVIGNSAYPGSSRLQNPKNDAEGISEKLRLMGFTVTTVTDANRSRLLQALSQFGRSAATSDVSVLYYSGHGVQIDGTNYMLPTDIDNADALQATLQGVSLNTVVENFLPGKARLVFLDACRDNPLRLAGTRSIAKGLAPISVAQGTLIAYSTRDGQVALDGLGGRYSPFTQALIEHLGDPSDIGVVLRKVREKVMQRTNGRQQPWEYGSLTGGELVLSTIKGSN
jgi:hypothetical protein